MIWLVLACLLPGMIGALLLFTYQYREGRTQQEKQMIQTVRALVQAVDNHLRKGEALALALSTADSLNRHDLALFYKRASKVATLAGLGTNVVVRNEAGIQLVNTAIDFDQPLPREAAPDQVRAVFANGKPTISNLFIGPLLKRPIMSVDVPVIIDGKVIYALGVGILPEHFNAILKAQNLPSGWVGAVLDSTGTIVGRNYSADKFVGNKASVNLLEAIKKSPAGSLQTRSQEGIPVLTFYSRSSGTNWTVAIGIPSEDLEAALLQPLYYLALGVLTLFAIGLVLAWLMGGRIAHSVSALSAHANVLVNGLSAPTPGLHIREAAEVAAAIGRAADLLQERAIILQLKETELANAHRLAKFGNWHWNLVNNEVTTSASIPEIYGREVPSFPEQRGTLLTIESWNRVHDAAQRVQQTGKGYDLELEINHGSGRTIWINAKCEALRNAENQVFALRGTVQDITEQKLAEEKLRESEKRFRLLADNIAQLAWMADGSGTIFWYNQRWVDYTGATLNEMQLSGWEKILHPEHIHRVVAKIHDCFKTGEPWEDTFPLANKDGTYRWFLSRAIPECDSTGRVLRWFGTHTDITAKRELRLSLRKRLIELDAARALIKEENDKLAQRVDERTSELKIANQELDSFAYAVSHDLRAPLRAMSGFSQALLEDYGQLLPAEAHLYLDQINLASLRMGDLIDGLLVLSRSARAEMHEDNIDLSRMANGILAELARTDAQRAVTYEVEPGLMAFGDARMVASVMRNLLDNAWKYTRHTAQASIRVYPEIKDGVCFFCVADNGAGFDMAYASKLFQPFQRLHRQEDFQGTGIGLATVQRIVHRHGGIIKAEGMPGKGATFCISLPTAERAHKFDA